MTKEEMMKLEDETLLYVSVDNKLIMFKRKNLLDFGYMCGSFLYPFCWFRLATKTQLDNFIHKMRLETENQVIKYSNAYEKTKEYISKNCKHIVCNPKRKIVK